MVEDEAVGQLDWSVPEQPTARTATSAAHGAMGIPTLIGETFLGPVANMRRPHLGFVRDWGVR